MAAINEVLNKPALAVSSGTDGNKTTAGGYASQVSGARNTSDTLTPPSTTNKCGGLDLAPRPVSGHSGFGRLGDALLNNVTGVLSGINMSTVGGRVTLLNDVIVRLCVFNAIMKEYNGPVGEFFDLVLGLPETEKREMISHIISQFSMKNDNGAGADGGKFMDVILAMPNEKVREEVVFAFMNQYIYLDDDSVGVESHSYDDDDRVCIDPDVFSKFVTVVQTLSESSQAKVFGKFINDDFSLVRGGFNSELSTAFKNDGKY